MSFAPALSRPLATRALRAVLRRSCFVVAACLTVAAAARLSAQNPGDLVADDQPSNAPTGFAYYTQFIRNDVGANGSIIPRLFVGGDQFGLYLLDLDNGVTVAKEIFDYTDINATGSTARIVYTAVPERVAPVEGSQPSVLIGGLFGRSSSQISDKQPAQNIKRLLASGRLDGTFDVGRGANNYVTAIVPLLDGGVLVGGVFDQFNGQDRQHIVRLDGSGQIVDSTTFDSNLNFDAPVLSIAEETNPNAGQIALPQYVVAGQFSNVNGSSHQKLARISGNGIVDASFNPSFDQRTTVVVCQPDGKILVGGDFSTVNGQPVKHLVRLNYDGSIDTSFVANVTGQPFGFVSPPAVYVIKLLTDGRMYLGGNFTTVNGVTRRFLARVDTNGNVDPAFDPGTNIINAVQSISVQATDGHVLVGESISQSRDGVRPPTLIRLYAENPTTLRLKAKGKQAVVSTGKQGVFLVRRTNAVSNALPYTFNVTLSGTAVTAKIGNVKGDYVPIQFPGGAVGTQTTSGGSSTYQVTVPANVDKLPIGVKPRKKSDGSSNGKTVTLTLDDGQSATVTIVNN